MFATTENKRISDLKWDNVIIIFFNSYEMYN